MYSCEVLRYGFNMLMFHCMSIAYLQYYGLETNLVFILTGCPAILRSAKGSENSVLAACHMALRHNHALP